MRDIEGEYMHSPLKPEPSLANVLIGSMPLVFVHYTSIDAVQTGPSGFRALADVSFFALDWLA
jgi:hypothetical protein